MLFAAIAKIFVLLPLGQAHGTKQQGGDGTRRSVGA